MMSVPSPATLDELSGNCFACSPTNPQGLHLQFELAEGTATARITLNRMHESAPGVLHGGIIAALFDEAMSKLNGRLGVLAMTRHLQVDYLKPGPLDVELEVKATHVRRDGRKLFHRAELRGRGGELLAQADALFLVAEQP